jgi:hypothetical protein
MNMRIILMFAFLFYAECHAEEFWDSEANIRSAISAFQSIQNSRGNEAVVREISKCYQDATQAQGLTKALEYCIAFDVINIEITTTFYEVMEKKYKIPASSSRQPEETKIDAGSERIIRNLATAKVDNPKEMARSIYYKTSKILSAVLLQNSERSNSALQGIPASGRP